MNTVYRGKLDTAFADFIPWADPYITSLVEKVCRRQPGENTLARTTVLRADAAPPLTTWHPEILDEPEPRRGFSVWEDQ